MISDEGISACFGVGVGVGGGLGIKHGDIAKRSGIYTTGEATGKFGPLEVSTGFEVDPCGNMTQTPGKFTGGPLSVDLDGNVEVSLDPEKSTEEFIKSTKLELEGKFGSKYCATTLD